jgi:hypothetical protein
MHAKKNPGHVGASAAALGESRGEEAADLNNATGPLRFRWRRRKESLGCHTVGAETSAPKPSTTLAQPDRPARAYHRAGARPNSARTMQLAAPEPVRKLSLRLKTLDWHSQITGRPRRLGQSRERASRSLAADGPIREVTVFRLTRTGCIGIYGIRGILATSAICESEPLGHCSAGIEALQVWGRLTCRWANATRTAIVAPRGVLRVDLRSLHRRSQRHSLSESDFRQRAITAVP